MGKQAYKLELPQKWKICNVFYISLLKLDIAKNKLVERMAKLNVGNNNSKKYKVKGIQDNIVYVNKSELDQLSGFYYLIT